MRGWRVGHYQRQCQYRSAGVRAGTQSDEQRRKTITTPAKAGAPALVECPNPLLLPSAPGIPKTSRRSTLPRDNVGPTVGPKAHSANATSLNGPDRSARLETDRSSSPWSGAAMPGGFDKEACRPFLVFHELLINKLCAEIGALHQYSTS
jgi:hypothetical protein